VLVTNYRRPLFTDAMLTFAETTMRAVCAELDVEMVEFNDETDHLHLLVAYPPTLTIPPPGPASQRPYRSHGSTRVHR
jgi:putative transposase